MKTIPFTSPRGCISYLLLDESTRAAAIIDPSQEIDVETYLGAIADAAATLRYVIETHTHADHLSAAPVLMERTGAKMIRHAKAPSEKNDVPVEGGETILLGNTEIRIIATPGHTNESISLYAGTALFTGDALLIGGTGRTDFQLGDSASLYDSLHGSLATLPDDTTVYPAHDYKGRISSTIGEEKKNNPRLLLNKEEFIQTMDMHHPPTPELFEESVATNSR